jgi:hypothetical protein
MNIFSCGSSDWERVLVFHHERGEEISYLMKKETGDLYWDEDVAPVAVKCALVFVATPLYTLGVMSWYALQIPFDLLDPKKIVKDIWNVARVPIYALGMELALCYGLITLDLYGAREKEAAVESALWRGASYKEDLRMKNRGENDKVKAFYLAWCFQKRGNIRDHTFTLLDLFRN